MTNSLMLATCMLNIGTLFSVSAMASAATASFVGASAFGLVSLINFAKVWAPSVLPCPAGSALLVQPRVWGYLCCREEGASVYS